MHLHKHLSQSNYRQNTAQHHTNSIPSSTMLFNLSTVKALSLASILATAQASPMGSADNDLDRRIVGNEAQSILCITPGNKKCGLWVSYTNGQTRQTVKFETGGTIGCSIDLLRKHTNSAGFWADLNFVGSAGLNIGFNPTNSEIALGQPTFHNNDQTHLNARCFNEFGWTDSVDASQSTESFWGDLSKKLF